MCLACLEYSLLKFLLIPTIFSLNAKSCNWPITDTLFILDSTVNVGGQANHRKILDFVADSAKAMLTKSSAKRTFFGVDVTRLSSIAVVQFTPEAKYEFGFVEDENFERLERKIENTPFLPCLMPDYCQQAAVSWNTIVEWMSSIEEGNRPNIPDVIILVTSSIYQPPELKVGELLVRPRSPIHIFIVSVGEKMPSEAALKPLQFAATTVHLAVIDFGTLKEMVVPLCESVQSFLGNEISAPENSLLSGSNCIFCLAIFVIVTLILLSTLFFLMCRYHQETTKFRSQITKEKENLKKQDDFYRSRLYERTIPDKDQERKMIELVNESNRMKDQRETSLHNLSVPTARRTRQKGPPSVIVAPARGRRKARQERPENHLEERRNSDPNSVNKYGGGRLTVDNGHQHSYSNDELNHLSNIHYESDEDSLLFEYSTTHLPNEHPALGLPPVDILLLVDASGSIGNVSFEQIKKYLKSFISGVDIAPGRSRVSTVLFAKEPQVMFDFDQYYTNKAVRAAIQRLPYLGGQTFLAKALSFAAGVLWQEQNMKEVRHKHRSLPTPRHDRLQVMVVVSDGVSDDDFDRQATHLHEKMLVKIAAVVTKSFNKEKLRPITRYDGAIFLLSEKEALNIWLWNSQKMWNENFGSYVEREKTFHAAEKPFNINNYRDSNDRNSDSFLQTSGQEIKAFSQNNYLKKLRKNREVTENNGVEQHLKAIEINEGSV